MKLTIVLYNNKKMIGKYLVDTISKTLDTFEREDDFLLNTEFTYERMVDFLKGRQIDFGRKKPKGTFRVYLYSSRCLARNCYDTRF